MKNIVLFLLLSSLVMVPLAGQTKKELKEIKVGTGQVVLESLNTVYAIAIAITASEDAAIIVAIPPGPILGRIPEKPLTTWQRLEYQPQSLCVVLA